MLRTATLPNNPPPAVLVARGTSIELVNGRSFHGIMPGYARHTIEEHRLRDELARQLSGVTEAFMGVGGRADVLTRNRVFEVKPVTLWQSGFRQLLGYAALSGVQPGLALFGLAHSRDIRRVFQKLQDVKLSGLRVPGPPELWWWVGTRWEHLSTPAQCTDMPTGARFGRCTYCDSPVAWPGESALDGAPRDVCRRKVEDVHHCSGICQAAHAGRGDCLYHAAARFIEATAAAGRR